MNKTRYIFIALFTMIIMIDVVSMFFTTVVTYSGTPSPYDAGYFFDSHYSVISMLGSSESDALFSALIYFTIIFGPLFALITVGTMKAPMKTVWKVLFIIYLLLNLIHSFLVFFIMIFDLWGPAKYLTVAGWIPIGFNVLSAVFLFVIAVSKGAARGVLKSR